VSKEGDGYCVSIDCLSDLSIEMDFTPVEPLFDFDSVVDFLTPEGNIFHRFCLKGYVTVPNVYSTVRITEAENTKLRKKINLPVPLTKDSIVMSSISVIYSR
jgi:hypothetical protein